MAQSGQWSRRSSNDTLTSDTLTNFLDSSNRSSNRSSTGSLPFPLENELIRQNHQEWLHLERIFYGEEPLPADEKTREEFLDWMETFPHLRLIGKSVNTDRFRINRNPIYHEEIIAADPPPPADYRTLRRGMDFQPNLTSKSGLLLTRRFDCDFGDDCDRDLTPRIRPGKRNKELVVLTARPGDLTSNSANLCRLPVISSSSSNRWIPTAVERKRPDPSHISGDLGQRMGRPSPLKSTITLPLINVDRLPVTFGDLLTTRSISAIQNHQQALKKGNSKEESR